MKHLTLPASDEAERLAYEGLRRRRADLTHYDLLIEEPTVLYHEGETEPFAVYDVLETRPDALVEALRGVTYESSLRSDGMTGRSRAFGARPRIVLRSMEFCSPFASNTNFPEAYEGLLAFGAAMGEHLRRWRQ